eukprot:SAG31_NODE_31486_length_367_cov_1.503731_1_plen_60_part_10
MQKRQLIHRALRRIDSSAHNEPVSSEEGATSNLVYVEWYIDQKEQKLGQDTWADAICKTL